MQILKKTYKTAFPFKWADLDYYPDSNAKKIEIYLSGADDLVAGLNLLFHTLFKNLTQEIIIYEKAWWGFCLDTWNINTDEYDYRIEGKSEEIKEYLQMLNDSEIKVDYSGSCECTNWDIYLPIVLRCLISHQAPYSPLFYNEANNFFFYFHHTGSLGLYYQPNNEVVEQIIDIASKQYELKL